MNGKIFRSNAEDCRKKGGQCFGTEEDAIRNCKACWWCCLDGKIFRNYAGGLPEQRRPMLSKPKREAQAHQKECTPKGWCCLDGEIFPSTPEECKERGGQYYLTKEEAIRHQKECKPCWCCRQGREGKILIQTTEADCKAQGGQCFSSKEEAAEHDCIGWCCLNGEVFPSTPEECQKKGGKWFATEREANAYCKKCWCCVKGDFNTPPPPFQTTEEECRKAGGHCYDTKEAASKDCGGGGGWCCFDTATGFTVAQKSKADCDKEVYGKWFASEQDARKACEFPPDCWCCIYNTETRKVSVVLTTTADCKAKGGRCFDSEQEAKDCGANRFCWVCIDGQVGRVLETEAKAKGLQCYSSGTGSPQSLPT